MEIPNYQSRGQSPKTSGLDPDNPGIVGGGPIVQGLSNAASGLLVYAHAQQQQQQAEQVALAGNIESTVLQEVMTKAQELREILAQDPNNIKPKDLSRDYLAHIDTTIDNALNLPDVQNAPYLRKHLETHLFKSARPYATAFEKEMNGHWAEQNQYQLLKGIDERVRVAAASPPEMQADHEKAIDTLLLGGLATGSLKGGEADTARANARKEISGQRADSILETQPEAYLAAIKGGTREQFWINRGVPPTMFDRAQQKEQLAIATQLADRNANESKRVLDEAKRIKTETYEKNDRMLMAKYLDHAQDQSQPALTFGELGFYAKHDKSSGPVLRAFEGLLKSDATAARQSNVHVKNALYTRLNLDWGDPKKLTDTSEIIKETANGNLTVEDARELVADFDLAKTTDGRSILSARESFLKSKMSAITNSNMLQGKLDHEGDDLYGKFTHTVYKAEAEARRQNRNPHHLYDPEKPEYIGALVGQFQKTPQQSLKTITQKIALAEPSKVKARLPNETPEQYLKRIEK